MSLVTTFVKLEKRERRRGRNFTPVLEKINERRNFTLTASSLD
jgi:hypothetical protein